MKIMINCDGRGWAKHSRGASHKILIGFMEKIKIGLRENSLKAMQHVFVMLKWTISNEIKTCFNCWLLLIRSISKIVEEFQCFSGISNLANIYLQPQPQSTLLLWRHAPNLWKYLLKGSGEYYQMTILFDKFSLLWGEAQLCLPYVCLGAVHKWRCQFEAPRGRPKADDRLT